MILFTKIGSRYQKQGKNIEKWEVEKELTKAQLYRLNKTGKCQIRESKIEIKDQVDTVSKTNKKELKLLNKVKSLYKVEKGYQKGKKRLVLWRRNERYGYYNFVTYFDNESDLDELIVKDQKNQKDNKTTVYSDEGDI